jgi:hypothetical protein
LKDQDPVPQIWHKLVCIPEPEEYLPAVQSVHEVKDVCLAKTWYVPALHSVQ